MATHTIVLLGDSLTQQGYARDGWVGRLADEFAGRAHVINSAYSGYNSRWFRGFLADPAARDVIFPPFARQPLFATLLLGGNDMATNPRYGVPLEEFKDNMRAIIRDALATLRPRTALALMTTTPSDEDVCGAFYDIPPAEISYAGSVTYAAAVAELADECAARGERVLFVDVHSAFLAYGRGGGGGGGADTAKEETAGAAAGAAALRRPAAPPYDPGAPWTRLLDTDGLHLNADGGALVFATLMEALRRSPYWDEGLAPRRSASTLRCE